jgi:riboflavin synthase
VFTGLVREVGRVASFEGGRVTIEAPQTAPDARVGDSIAIDGVCLTVVSVDGGSFAFDAVPETLSRTSLATLEPGSRVNLEPALRAGDEP